jgi:hypothetical protein
MIITLDVSTSSALIEIFAITSASIITTTPTSLRISTRETTATISFYWK